MSKKEPDEALEPIRVRALIEEANANVFVENFLYAEKDALRIVWLRFLLEGSTPERVITQVKTISTDFNIQLLLFAVGRSYYLSYSSVLGAFHKVKSWQGAVPSLEEMDRLCISQFRVKSKVKAMFLEDRWRKLSDDYNLKDSR